MAYSISYFNSKVLEQIEAWPVELLADYAKEELAIARKRLKDLENARS